MDKSAILSEIAECECVADLKAIVKEIRTRLHALRDDLPSPGGGEVQPNDAWFIAKAQERHKSEGFHEVDDTAFVSRGDDPGAYVEMWVWVDSPEPEDEGF